jgi:hypothetical protein
MEASETSVSGFVRMLFQDRAQAYVRLTKFRPSWPRGVTPRSEAGQRLGFVVKSGDNV